MRGIRPRRGCREQFRRLMQAREIRDNLARMTEAGAIVHYYSADVAMKRSSVGCSTSSSDASDPWPG